ncbi:hypothetical protein Nepgr_013156 [Nepenthes gracilis]|uniref:Uncharacterized protein n=1 Tax=Nepenthes gracilis TaxID=150966 RepID=A0AAD3SGY9_NEPGR|nr:hypothetical protein Nepgr_013156 [Nepenthes gracilis]
MGQKSIVLIKQEKVAACMLLALQFFKGFKQGEEIYLGTLKKDLERPNTLEVPRDNSGVLIEFREVMPQELPKQHPPRREIDHLIELEPGAKPPVVGPHHMASLELEELRRQLKELLDVGFIQPSKTPFLDVH